jgi:hypothetical protein
MGTIEDEVFATFPLSRELMEEYSGKWIAVRDGTTVIASADEFEDLTSDDEVSPNDTVYRVPERTAFLL